MVRMWIRSKKFSPHVHLCSASSISNLTLGGTLAILVIAILSRQGTHTRLAVWDSDR
jgi:hypothetical protein